MHVCEMKVTTKVSVHQFISGHDGGSCRCMSFLIQDYDCPVCESRFHLNSLGHRGLNSHEGSDLRGPVLGRMSIFISGCHIINISDSVCMC